MLILTRKLNQKLIINDNIEIVILETSKNTVKIGVNAPNNVQIYREEVYKEIKRANAQAQKIDINTISNILPKTKSNINFNLTNKLQKHD